jgi:O-antigen/teichoic acid export membrane protein
VKRLVMTGLRKLGGFGTSTLVTGLVALFAIPFVVSFAGPMVWGGIAVAQAIAGMAAVLISFGWGVMGPVRIASSRHHERGQLYVDSLVFRLFLLVLVLPPTAYLIAIWAPGNTIANICTGTALIIGGIGGYWFYVGEGRAWRLFVVDTIPRCSGTLVGALLLGFTGNVIFFAASQMAGALLAVSLAAVDILRRHEDYRWRESMVAKRQILSFKEQLPGVLTAVAPSLYMNAPLAVLAGLAPASVPVYAMADKIIRFAAGATSPLTQVAQSSVPSPDAEKQARNIVLATKVSTVGAVTSGLFLALALPWAAHLLSAGKIEVPLVVSSAFGVSLAAIVFTEISGLASLMALGRAKTVAISVSLGLCVAVPLVFIFAAFWGAAGAAWALAVSEGAVALFQFAALRNALKEGRLSPGRTRSSLVPDRPGHH